MKIKCKKCGDIIEGDNKGTYITCSCRSIAIDQTPAYTRIVGFPEHYEEVKDDRQTIRRGKNIKK